MKKFDVRKRSFYISLCVCVMAISAAGWSTYKSIKDFSLSDQRQKTEQLPQNLRRKQTSEKTNLNPISQPKKENKNQALNQSQPNEKLKEVSAKIPNSEFIYPLDYIEYDKFNDDLEYSEKFQDWRTSDGINFRNKLCSDVISIANGKIIEIFDDPSYGMTVKIEHKSQNGDEILTYYSELDNEIYVKKGDNVIQGQKISKTKGDKMHFMIQINKKFVNPMEFLG